jgi:protein involved in polysaccharide export with SLBB domain
LNLTPDLEALQRGDRSQNVELQPGDTVVVPFRRTGGGFLSRLDPVFLIGFLAPYIIRP